MADRIHWHSLQNFLMLASWHGLGELLLSQSLLRRHEYELPDGHGIDLGKPHTFAIADDVFFAVDAHHQRVAAATTAATTPTTGTGRWHRAAGAANGHPQPTGGGIATVAGVIADPGLCGGGGGGGSGGVGGRRTVIVGVVVLLLLLLAMMTMVVTVVVVVERWW